MKAILQHPQYGQIEYKENIWTGKKQLLINGIQLEKQNKKTFAFPFAGDSNTCTLAGDFIRGAKLNIGTDSIQLTRSAKWYELALSILIAVLIMTWGNSVTLCSIIPIVGGGIGGLIAGIGAVINLYLIKPKEKLWQKLLFSLYSMLGTFYAAHLVFGILFSTINILS